MLPHSEAETIVEEERGSPKEGEERERILYALYASD